jgi:two-component system chemotaxis sensor kinase CheA
MPRLDGFELTRRIRASEAFRDLPIVLVTARDSRADEEKGLGLGANAYIVKGRLDQENLLATIRGLLPETRQGGPP